MTDNLIYNLILEKDVSKNEEALKELYVDNYYMIENFVIKYGGSKEDAKDVFQESIILLYNNIKTRKFELKSKISTYLYSVSRNIWFKKNKREKRESALDEKKFENLASSDNVIEQIVYTEEQILIGKLLTKSGERCKQILKLYYFEKNRMKEIAKSLGYASEQVAKNQKAKCMKKLKSIVKNSDYYNNNLGKSTN